MSAKSLFPGVYTVDGKLATKNMVKGKTVYGEKLIVEKNVEYRLWTPYRSKLSAAIMNGLNDFKIKSEDAVLYLGVASGTTPSHISDIIGEKGRLYGVEISERSMRDFVTLCHARKNMLPILADARYPENYADTVEQCDIIYQDVAAKEQAMILKENSKFLKKGGYAYFVIKSQSVDMAKPPKEVYKEELAKLESTFEILEKLSLEPYDSLHLFVVLKKK